jgi:hypothetical protein
MHKYKYRIEIELNDNQQFDEQQFIKYTKDYITNVFAHYDVKIYYVNDLFLVQSDIK